MISTKFIKKGIIMTLNKNLLVWSFNKKEGSKWIKFSDEISELVANKEFNKIKKLKNAIEFKASDDLKEVKSRILNMYYYLIWDKDNNKFEYDFLKD